MRSFMAGHTPMVRRVMFFIDGGYLRETLKEITGDENFALFKFPLNYSHEFVSGSFRPELVRTYYYDAICVPDDPSYKEKKAYFDALNSYENVEVKLGYLIKTKNGFRQKGIDILIAIDVLTKAYQDHYDYAILFCGDRDFLPLVQEVKDSTGKKIYGMMFEGHYSEALKNEFDRCKIIADKDLHKIR